MHRSTRAFLREARRTHGFSLFDWLHAYIYARWPYTYIAMGMRRHPVARAIMPLIGFYQRAFPARPRKGARRTTTFADTYHGKVVPLAAATQLVNVHEEITLKDLEQVVPYALARDIVLRNPQHIVALECPCRAARANPCLPLDVCLLVGEPFASFAIEHNPRRARWITADEAVEILRAEDARGHAHHAFFKDAMLGRFYAICNCCSCCCGAIEAHRHGTPMLASSGYVSRVDADACIGCGACTAACPFGALSLASGCCVVDSAACMGCGVCVGHCAHGALALARDAARGEPLEIRALMEAAAEGQ
ncbi:MAG: 4Fe-4S dicluster domain-containing protein [Anaerolineae bacterium]